MRAVHTLPLAAVVLLTVPALVHSSPSELRSGDPLFMCLHPDADKGVAVNGNPTCRDGTVAGHLTNVITEDDGIKLDFENGGRWHREWLPCPQKTYTVPPVTVTMTAPPKTRTVIPDYCTQATTTSEPWPWHCSGKPMCLQPNEPVEYATGVDCDEHYTVTDCYCTNNWTGAKKTPNCNYGAMPTCVGCN